MELKGWIVLIFILIISTFLLGFVMSQNKTDGERSVIKKEVIKIAVCPTYHEVVNSLNEAEYEIIKTNSTAESLELLSDNKVEFVLSGRPLKPNEGSFQQEFIVQDGYSFVSAQEQVINQDNLNNEIICTDLDKTEVEKKLNLKNIQQVQEIADCFDNSIIVTSWDRTDYSKTKIVQVINSDGSRYSLSRTPILYCHNNCSQEIIDQIKIAYKKLNRQFE